MLLRVSKTSEHLEFDDRAKSNSSHISHPGRIILNNLAATSAYTPLLSFSYVFRFFSFLGWATLSWYHIILSYIYCRGVASLSFVGYNPIYALIFLTQTGTSAQCHHTTACLYTSELRFLSFKYHAPKSIR